MATRKKSHFQGLVVVKRRKILTVKQKLEIIEALEHNRSAKEIADLFGISKLQIFRIAKQKKTLLAAWKNNKNPDQKKIRRRRYQDVEEALLAWINDTSCEKKPPSRDTLMKQACLIAKNIGRLDFKPSRFWLQNWATVNKVNLMKMPLDDTLEYNNVDVSSGHQSNQSLMSDTNTNISQITHYQDQAQGMHSNSIYPSKDTSTAKHTATMQSLLLKYDTNDIYNIGTVALYYRALPQKLSGFKNEATMTEKNPWDIISVVLATNMTGSDKSEVWVIGQDEGSRDCFKGINNIPVTYVSSEDTCMSPGIFTEWVQRFDEALSKENRKVALIVQLTAASSVNVSLTNINLVILPQSKNVVQPLDHGITSLFKKCYRRQIVERILLSAKSEGDIFSKAISQAIAYDVDLLDSAHMIHNAWKNVNQEIIQEAFAKAGLKNCAEDNMWTTNEDDPPPEGMTIDEFSSYVSIDDNIAPVVIGEDEINNTNNDSSIPVDGPLHDEEDEFVDLVTNSDGESSREIQQFRRSRRQIIPRQFTDYDGVHFEPASGEDILESDASDGLNDYYGNTNLSKRKQVSKKSAYQLKGSSSEFQPSTSTGQGDYVCVSSTPVQNVNNNFVEPRAQRPPQRREQRRIEPSDVPTSTEALIALATVRRYLDHIGNEQYDSFLKVESAVISHCSKDLR